MFNIIARRLYVHMWLLVEPGQASGFAEALKVSDIGIEITVIENLIVLQWDTREIPEPPYNQIRKIYRQVFPEDADVSR